jgi:GNAT superfamily N-acetyltransferase
MAVEVVPVTGPEGLRVFNAFPEIVYRGAFTAPAFPIGEHAGRRRDRLFERVEAQPFLAITRGHAAGRIAAGVHSDSRFNSKGYFGYFEALPNTSVAAALIEAASAWLAGKGAKVMLGPVDLTPHERVGLLVDGFRGVHLPGMPYNPPYYQGLLQASGLELEMELLAYHYDIRSPLPERLVRVASRSLNNQSLRIRELDWNNLNAEGEIFSRIHNGSMQDIWGFAPLSPEEGAAIWRRLKGFYDPGLILIAEMDGKPAGLCLTLSLLKRNSGMALAGSRTARLAVLAVLPAFRFKGLEAALILECILRARRRGVLRFELSQIAESNRMMNKIIQNMGQAKKGKTYRVYRNNQQNS